MVEIRQSTVIDAPIDAVWSILRDFNGHHRWHPAVDESVIEAGEPVDAVGSVRRFRLTDGSAFREQLIALSDKDRLLRYCLLEAPVPLMGYVAMIRLKRVTDGDRTFWEWRSEFRPPPERQAELVKLVTEGIYQAGFAAVRGLLRRAPAAMPPSGPPLRDALARPSSAMPPAPPPPIASKRPGTRPPQQRTPAILVERYGGPEVLELVEIETPPPASHEVQVRHTAIGVNYIDVYCRTGYFDLMSLPGIPGMEAVGVIEAAGSEVSDFAVGERVACAGPPIGAYCGRRNRPPDLLVRLPDDIDDLTAAAGLLKGITASFLLFDVHTVRPGQVVVVHAAAGGVGQLLVQWARALGARVVATVSTDDKADIALRLGAEHAVVYTRDDFAAAVLRLTDGRGADVVYDAVGTDTFAASLAALAVRGHLVSFGQASGPVGNWDIGTLAAKSITVSRPNYGHYTDTSEKLAPHVDRFFAALRHGIVRLQPPRLYPLAEAANAHRDLESRRTTGALVLTP